jgi:nucleoid-associated protein YgaU
MMTRTARIVVPVALLAAVGAALSLGIRHMQPGPAADVERPATAKVISPSSPSGQDVIAAIQAETKNVATALGAPGSPRAGDEGAPAFDVARIEPSGDAVIAGRATPGASVELLRNGKLHDRVVADKFGQFAMVPPRLPPGDYELTLRSTQPDGKFATSKDSVVVALQPSLKEQPVVALMKPDRPSIVLSKPAASNNSAGEAVAVETVETEPNGKLYVSGRSPPGASVRLYLNDSYLASATAAVDGRFAFTVNEGVGPGGYRIRLDEVESGSGAIRSRAEVPFNMPQTVAAKGSGLKQTVGSSQSLQASQSPLQSAKSKDVVGSAASREVAAASTLDAGSPAAVTVPRVSTAVVSRGDSLWRISRSAYGAGDRYTVIYGANHSQIRNPNLIYPGQVFVLPEKER